MPGCPDLCVPVGATLWTLVHEQGGWVGAAVARKVGSLLVGRGQRAAGACCCLLLPLCCTCALASLFYSLHVPPAPDPHSPLRPDLSNSCPAPRSLPPSLPRPLQGRRHRSLDSRRRRWRHVPPRCWSGGQRRQQGAVPHRTHHQQVLSPLLQVLGGGGGLCSVVCGLAAVCPSLLRRPTELPAAHHTLGCCPSLSPNSSISPQPARHLGGCWSGVGGGGRPDGGPDAAGGQQQRRGCAGTVGQGFKG